MRNSPERRRPGAWRLRIYIDAIKDAEATTDVMWLESWIAHCERVDDIDSQFMSRATWIAMLKQWALREAAKLTNKHSVEVYLR